MSNNRPIAFVAMRFDADHWRDKRYIAIREELEHAGFTCIRADEVATSGPVVDEVCRLLREADLVVIDSSGDSHSVSYEIGYCHGINRPAETTLLLRRDANMPFNYRHYRHRVYKDLRHLRRFVRDFLRLQEPLSKTQYGYAFSFSFLPGEDGYIKEGAFCVFDALRDKKFTGRCECYICEHFALGRVFTVSIMLRNLGRDAKPKYSWWMNIQKLVEGYAQSKKDSIKFEETLSEMAAKGNILANHVPAGVAEFKGGHPIRLLGPNDDNDGSLIRRYCAERVQESRARKH